MSKAQGRPLAPKAREPDPSATKHCPRCVQDLPATTEHWYRAKGKEYGLSDCCKPCFRLRKAHWQSKMARGYTPGRLTPTLYIQLLMEMGLGYLQTTREMKIQFPDTPDVRRKIRKVRDAREVRIMLPLNEQLV